MVAVMPAGHSYTVDDLDRFPSDGNRYELIEGSLHVTPSPGMPHQNALFNLARSLDRACPPTMKVWVAPLDVVFAPGTVLEPDVFVLPADTPNGTRVLTTPLLAAEILWPSTRSYDLVTKRHVYREAGVGTYLVVDADESRVTVWSWADGGEVEQTVTGDEAVVLDRPFPLRFLPTDLV